MSTTQIYLGEAGVPEGLAEALSGAGLSVSREKAPIGAAKEDLAVISAGTGITSALRHEINNPLTAVLGFSQLLLRSPDLPPQVVDRLNTIYEHAKRVRDLLGGSS